MRIQLRNVQLKKPKTSYEKDEEAEAGVMSVTTLTIEVDGMDPEEVVRLARYAVYNHPLSITFESPQGDLVDAALRDGGVSSG